MRYRLRLQHRHPIRQLAVHLHKLEGDGGELARVAHVDRRHRPSDRIGARLRIDCGTSAGLPANTLRKSEPPAFWAGGVAGLPVAVPTGHTPEGPVAMPPKRLTRSRRGVFYPSSADPFKVLPNDACWITVRPNGPGTEGPPALIQPTGSDPRHALADRRVGPSVERRAQILRVCKPDLPVRPGSGRATASIYLKNLIAGKSGNAGIYEEFHKAPSLRQCPPVGRRAAAWRSADVPHIGEVQHPIPIANQHPAVFEPPHRAAARPLPPVARPLTCPTADGARIDLFALPL